MATETSVLAGLGPRAFWGHFGALTRIARPSRHEEPAIEHVRAWAVEHGFELQQDAGRNLVVHVPASPGLESAPTDDPLYDAGVKVLSEYVKHHVKEEEDELFPKVRSSGLDLEDLGGKLEARKRQLQGRAGRGSRNGSGGRRTRRESGTADEKRMSH